MRSGRPSDARWWEERTAIVTGASSGIGRAVAEAILGRGGKVALIARSADRLAEIAAPWSGTALVLPADVRDRAALQRQIQVAIEHWGRVDVLVHAAGVLAIQLVEELDDALAATLETNLLAAAWATQAVVPAMRRAHFGRIVYVGSVDGHVAPVGYAAYAMSKWGLRALVESLRAELRGRGILVSLVAPYYVKTPMLDGELAVGPLPGYDPRDVLEPAEVAAAILRVVASGDRELVLAPWTLRVGLVLGALLPGVKELVLARLGRPLVQRGQRQDVRRPQ